MHAMDVENDFTFRVRINIISFGRRKKQHATGNARSVELLELRNLDLGAVGYDDSVAAQIASIIGRCVANIAWCFCYNK